MEGEGVRGVVVGKGGGCCGEGVVGGWGVAGLFGVIIFPPSFGGNTGEFGLPWGWGGSPCVRRWARGPRCGSALPAPLRVGGLTSTPLSWPRGSHRAPSAAGPPPLLPDSGTTLGLPGTAELLLRAPHLRGPVPGRAAPRGRPQPVPAAASRARVSEQLRDSRVTISIPLSHQPGHSECESGWPCLGKESTPPTSSSNTTTAPSSARTPGSPPVTPSSNATTAPPPSHTSVSRPPEHPSNSTPAPAPSSARPSGPAPSSPTVSPGPSSSSTVTSSSRRTAAPGSTAGSSEQQPAELSPAVVALVSLAVCLLVAGVAVLLPQLSRRGTPPFQHLDEVPMSRVTEGSPVAPPSPS
ncbi:WAS/WASL-interacting protein family member 1-like isoform X2 [Passer domesticus]|uniref:WAS/WASL-interacting protein family member 1-like isoform X2 n=1 Tax=Passer domesticus TaxID=48849 RepID=UPI0030FEDAA6